MTQASEPSLTSRAQALLAETEQRGQDAAFRAELLSLALTCHGRMLELGERDRPAAVALAIAGADLLQARQSLGWPGEEEPFWVAIHEEQCCRYGGIWIHELLKEGHPAGTTHCRRGVALLKRLQQLHPEPLTWVSRFRRQLERAVPAPVPGPDPAPDPVPAPAETASPADAMRLVVVGNCQAHPLAIGLRMALPQLAIKTSPSVHLATADEVAELHLWIANADLLVMHRVLPGYRANIGLDCSTLLSLLPDSARSLVLPSLHYEGHHPWIAYAHDPDGRLHSLEAESPLCTYHDFLAMVAARDDLPLNALLEPACPITVLDGIRAQHLQSLAELQERETDCDLSLSDWLAANHRQQPLFHTLNHPTQFTLDQLLRRLLTQLQLPHQLSDALHDSIEHLGALSIPIHPWVRQALALDAWAETWGQRQGTPLTIEQQLQESLDFYHRHDWIVATNAHHPKLELAASLLHHSRRLTVAASTRPTGPSVAALINYFNDADMLAWQLKSGCLDRYDRIYLWDGPYGYLHQLPLFPDEAQRLDSTALGRQLLADPRVVYRYRHWRDEAEKRTDAYAAIEEDLVVLHDTDEFFHLQAEHLQRFWSSPYAVASQLVQNLYAGGLRSSDSHHTTHALAGLPHKRVLFRRSAISAERHLDYCWLVGVQQQPTEESLVDPQPLGHTYHLTGCRSTSGQAAKMAFYMSLALVGKGRHPVVERLHELVTCGAIGLLEAQRLFLRGDPGFAGVPHPAFGLSLNPRLPVPAFEEAMLEAMLAEANAVAAGTYTVLSGHPLLLWLPIGTAEQQLVVWVLEHPAPLELQSWRWYSGKPACQDLAIQSSDDALALSLPSDHELLGRLVSITVANTTPTPKLFNLRVDLVD